MALISADLLGTLLQNYWCAGIKLAAYSPFFAITQSTIPGGKSRGSLELNHWLLFAARFAVATACYLIYTSVFLITGGMAIQ